MSTEETLLVLLVYNLFLVLLGFMEFLIQSSKKDYKEYLDLIERYEGSFYKKLYLVLDFLDIVGCFIFIGSLPTISLLIYILQK